MELSKPLRNIAVDVLTLCPKGAAKRTQAALLASYWGVPHVSAGDIVRANIAAKTSMGMQLAAALTSRFHAGTEPGSSK